MSTHGEIKREIFKSVLRRYFFENPETILALSGIDLNTLKRDEHMRAIINNSDDKEIVDKLWEATQEKVFSNFYNRVLSSVLLNEKGERYKLPTDINGDPTISDELIDDFMAGKQIVFMGAGPDGMTSLSADKDELNQLLVHVNTVGRGKKETVPRIYERLKNPDGTEIHAIDTDNKWSIESSLFSTYGNVRPSETPPKSNPFQTLANRIKKWFTGRPTDRWAPYEKYQKMQELQEAISAAGTYKQAFDELKPEKIEAAQQSVGSTEWKKALKDILSKQKKKAAEELQAKKEAENEEPIQKVEEPSSNGPEEIKSENTVAEGLQEMTKETEEEKRQREEREKESLQKLNESDERRKAIEAYRRPYIGTEQFNSKQDKIFIANETHFKSIFAPGTYRENAIPEAVDMINTYLEKLNDYAQNDHVPFLPTDQVDPLPEMLANVYLLGKLISTYPDRYNSLLTNIKECPYEELPEYNQILERFDLIKKNLTTFFKETNLPASIRKDPRNVINNMVLNPKVPFFKRFDSVLADRGVYTAVSNKIKGIEEAPKPQNEKQPEPVI